jgi:hypothetical protein
MVAPCGRVISRSAIAIFEDPGFIDILPFLSYYHFSLLIARQCGGEHRCGAAPPNQ